MQEEKVTCIVTTQSNQEAMFCSECETDMVSFEVLKGKGDFQKGDKGYFCPSCVEWNEVERVTV